MVFSGHPRSKNNEAKNLNLMIGKDCVAYSHRTLWYSENTKHVKIPNMLTMITN